MTKEKKKEIMEWAASIAAAVVLALLIRSFVFEFVVVRQTSMYPNLVAGNRVGVSHLSYLSKLPSRGDIVIIKVSEKENYIKRVIALPGETVEIIDSTVYINGKPLTEEYIGPDVVCADFPKTTVMEGHIFVMGDNRGVSIDSRSEKVGQVELSNIIGKAVFRLSPWEYYGF